MRILLLKSQLIDHLLLFKGILKRMQGSSALLLIIYLKIYLKTNKDKDLNPRFFKKHFYSAYKIRLKKISSDEILISLYNLFKYSIHIF